MSGAVAVRGATLFDGTGAEPFGDSLLLTDASGSIAYAGPASAGPPIDPGLREIDASGYYLLPGLIDPHAHMLAYAFNLEKRLTTHTTLVAFRTMCNLRTTLESLASQASVKVESMEPQTAPANDAYRETKVEVSLAGVTLPQTVNYLHQIEVAPQVLSVKSLRIRTRPCAAVLDRFRTWPEVVACYSLAGPVDAMLIVETGDALALSRLVDRLSAVPGVGEIETAPILAESARAC